MYVLIVRDEKSNRYSYQCLSYVLRKRGENVNDNLPGEDKQETVNSLYTKAFSWLEE